MRAITVLGYWAWAIVHGPKAWENRTWATNYRGPLAIHCGVSRKADRVAAEFLRSLGVALPALEVLEDLRGCVIGACELVACERPDGGPGSGTSRLAGDPFATGPCCWGLASRRALPRPVACMGRLSLWTLPPEVQEQVDRQLRLVPLGA